MCPPVNILTSSIVINVFKLNGRNQMFYFKFRQIKFSFTFASDKLANIINKLASWASLIIQLKAETRENQSVAKVNQLLKK